jgi:hypothetical protein
MGKHEVDSIFVTSNYRMQTTIPLTQIHDNYISGCMVGDTTLNANELREYHHYARYFSGNRNGARFSMGTTELADVYVPAFKTHVAALAGDMSDGTDMTPTELYTNVALDFLRYGKPAKSTDWNDAFARASMQETIRNRRESNE